jgi:photosystem II stability/assembly factor-like uncharacterized protein
MKKLFVVLVMLVAMNASGQLSWQPQIVDSAINLNYVKFFDIQTGIVKANSGVHLYKTTNTGQNWNLMWHADYGIYDIFFLNPQLGWISVANGGIPFFAFIAKTIDGGQSWTSFFNGGISCGSIYFISALTGWLIRDSLYRTSNGGASWQNYSLPDYYMKGLYFLNTNYGFCYNDASHAIYRTTNSGINWYQIYLSNLKIQNLTFTDSLTGYLCGNLNYNTFPGMVLKTINGGYNWTVVLEDTNQINKISFVNSNTGYALRNPNILFRTSNGGATWSKQIPDSSRTLLGINFLNAYTGWLVGNNGIILRTTNGGSTFINQNNTVPYTYSLSQNYPNPFNPSTNIRYAIPKSGMVRLVVFDALGREVETLVNESLKPGTYESKFNGANYPSGIYFYKLRAEGFTETKKMLLIK